MKKWFLILISQKGGGRIRHFVKCEKCGLVIDQTTYEMDSIEWEQVNVGSHGAYQGTNENSLDPNWIERLNIQGDLFVQLFREEVFSADMNIVDYGCGDGKLSDYFRSAYEQIRPAKRKATTTPRIKKYDKYMRRNTDVDYLSDEAIYPGAFDAVVSCSVFEHLLGKEEVEGVLELLNEKGVFCLHTLVCDEVPRDPDWFYLLPVHCTFWTNKAMELIYEEHGFKGCAYNVEARMWFLFKNREMFIKLKSNSSKIDGTWVFSDRFVDYWKQKPYR